MRVLWTIFANMGIYTNLEKWAKETTDFYDSMARSKFNRAFYTQSDLRHIKGAPEIMILAINPGGKDGSRYTSIDGFPGQIDQDKWKKWGVCKRMDAATFLKGNPMISTIEKWNLWKRLRTIFSFGKMEDILNDNSRYVYTNIVCFTTQRESDLSPDIFKACAPYTLKLIKILEPKMIICLGRNCFKHFCNTAKVKAETLIVNEITRTWIEGIPVIHIPHTSKYYSYEEMILIGRCLQLLKNTPQISADELHRQAQSELHAFQTRVPVRNISKEIAMQIENICNSELKNKNFDLKHMAWYSLPHNLMLCISHTSNGIVAIRHKEYNELKKAYNTDAVYPHTKELQKILETYGFKSTNVWLGIKEFKAYKGCDAEKKSLEILKEINKLTADIAKINW